jgi:hypothetical protein
MPLVARALEVRWWFVDDNGKFSHFSLNLPALTAFATARARAEAMIPRAAAISRCAFAGYELHQEVVEINPGTPDPDSDANWAGVFIFNTSLAGQRFLLYVPGVKDSILTTSGDFPGIAIDTSNPDVAALINECIDGTAPNLVGWQGNDLDSFSVAYKQWREATSDPIPKG